MAIPKEILEVERPVNTLVCAYGKNKDRYLVRQRVGCKRVDGKNMPVNGPTIGHIIDGKFVPKNTEKRVESTSIQIKDWAAYTLADSLFKDILEELNQIYHIKDATILYNMAILRVCSPGIKDSELKTTYDNSFLSELYPTAALSKNTVSNFLKNIGRAYANIIQFMQNRVKKVNINHHILIDGTLKRNNSKINSLSNFSRKTNKTGSKDISIIYAFDLEKKEPICSTCYPGNMLDCRAYSDFIKKNEIKNGILIADKEYFENNENHHYLNTITDNSKFIDIKGLFNYQGQLEGYPTTLYNKIKYKESEYLYSFKDNEKAYNDRIEMLNRNYKEGIKFNNDEYIEKSKSFGVIIFESDLDLDPITIYNTYNQRWEIELIMSSYKNACNFSDTIVNNKYCVYASEFCDFLSSILTYRLINKFDSIGLLNKYTYEDIMRILNKGIKVKNENQDWVLRKMDKLELTILKELGLIKDEDSIVKAKRGRPKK